MSQHEPHPEGLRCPACGAVLRQTEEGTECTVCLLQLGLDPARESSPMVEIEGYRVFEKLGEGGMGVVYLAEQLEPVRRMVAVKVIKSQADGGGMLERFEAERQALALMSHPNIAQVYDAGVTRSGSPYVAIEWVDGEAIDVFCERHKLDLDARLAHMIDVAIAVQHAHAKGVVHCDLKPSNVLVAQIDGAPVAKMIDFGIARAVDPEVIPRRVPAGSSASSPTVGTPAYMAPEMAVDGGGDVDTRADVYSLGALLYELVAGTPPFLKDDLQGRGADELLEFIAEENPPKPSERVAASGGGREVPEDLDWIVMQAMRKDREKRYQTAGQLADDLRRVLAKLPVSARPRTRAYLMQRFSQRHRGALVLSGAVALALAITTVLSILQAARAHRAELAAEERREQSEVLVDFMLRKLYGPLKDIGQLDLLQGVAEEAFEYYDGLPEEPGERRKIGRSNTLAKIGEIRSQLGERDASLEAVEGAYAILEPHAEDPDASDQLRFEFAQRSALLGATVREFRGPNASLGYLDNAVEIMRQLVASSEDEIYEGYLAGYCNVLGSTYLMLDDRAKALEWTYEALELREALRTADPESTARRSDVAKLYTDIARMHALDDESERGSELLAKALHLRETIAKERPGELSWQAQLASTHVINVRYELHNGTEGAALASADAAIGIWETLRDAEPRNVRWRAAHASALRVKAMIGIKAAQPEAYEASARLAIQVWESMTDSQLTARDRLEVARSYTDLGQILLRLGETSEARAAFESARDRCDEELAQNPIPDRSRVLFERHKAFVAKRLRRL